MHDAEERPIEEQAWERAMRIAFRAARLLGEAEGREETARADVDQSDSPASRVSASEKSFRQ